MINDQEGRERGKVEKNYPGSCKMTMGTNVISAWDTHANEYKHNLIAQNTTVYAYTIWLSQPASRSTNKF